MKTPNRKIKMDIFGHFLSSCKLILGMVILNDLH